MKICFPEVFWYARFFVFKCPVKVRHVVKTAFVGYFCYSKIGIDQHARCMAQPYFIQALNEGFASSFLKKPAER